MVSNKHPNSSQTFFIVLSFKVEWHPGCQEAALKKLCQKEGILLQAYSSLGGTGNRSLLNDPLIESIARKLNKSSAQVGQS